jgi:hypothetical protein
MISLCFLIGSKMASMSTTPLLLNPYLLLWKVAKNNASSSVTEHDSLSTSTKSLMLIAPLFKFTKVVWPRTSESGCYLINDVISSASACASGVIHFEITPNSTEVFLSRSNLLSNKV